MNKTEKLICLVLGAVLAWYIFSEMGKSKEAAKQAASAQMEMVSNRVDRVVSDSSNSSNSSVSNASSVARAPKALEAVKPSVPETNFCSRAVNAFRRTPAGRPTLPFAIKSPPFGYFWAK